jgi:hypothetical protein
MIVFEKALKLIFGVLGFIFLMPAIFAVGYFLSFATVLVFPTALFLYVYMIYDTESEDSATAVDILNNYRLTTNLIYFEDLVIDEIMTEKEQRLQHYKKIKLPMAG